MKNKELIKLVAGAVPLRAVVPSPEWALTGLLDFERRRRKVRRTVEKFYAWRAAK